MKLVFKLVFILIICLSYSSCNYRKQDSIVKDSLSNSETQVLGGITNYNDNQDSIVKQKKINKKNLIIKEWNTDLATNTKTLDHVTTYNADGKKIEEIEYNTTGQKWRERYEYDANGNKIRELLYDGRNKLISVKIIEYNEFGKKKITYTYNAQGKVISVKNYEYITQ